MTASSLVGVDQEFVIGDGSGRLGDCLRACVATLYRLPAEAVPHFVEHPDWFGALCEWAREDGYTVTYEGPSFPMYTAHRHVIALGTSPRDPDVTHAVVVDARTGELGHDPHPSRAGLASPIRSVLTFRSADTPLVKVQVT